MSARAAAPTPTEDTTPERPLLTWERRVPDARVLVVTSMWPHPRDLKYGVFVERQVATLAGAGVPCDVLFVRGHRSPLAYARAAAALLAWNARPPRAWRLVHAHGEAALPARAFARAPVMASYWGSDLLAGSAPRRALIRQHSRLLAATTTQSAEMERCLPPGVRARNKVLPAGIDRDTFAPVEHELARRRLGWDPHERVALFAADPAVARKRHDLAAAACRRAEARLGGVRLRVAANVPPGEMPLLMSAADCLLLTSSIEGSPNVVKEAAACDLPVVTTPVGDVAEVLRDVSPSYVVPGTEESLAGALEACLEHPVRSNGRQATAWLEAGAVGARLLEVYRDLGL